jgi:hypothetical protein
MLKPELSVAISERLHRDLSEFLIRNDQQEDLIFVLWTPSQGQRRQTALLHSPVFPKDGDRQIHGNVSFNPEYFERVCALALKEKCGIAFLHSHPFPGWQGMSEDDVIEPTHKLKSANKFFSLILIYLIISIMRKI